MITKYNARGEKCTHRVGDFCVCEPSREHNLQVIIKAVKHFGTVTGPESIGVHQIVENDRDVTNGFENALDKGFPRVFFYVSDLTLVKYILDTQMHIESNQEYAEFANSL